MFFSIHLFFSPDVDKQCMQYLPDQYAHIPVDSTLSSVFPAVENSVYLHHYNTQEIIGIQISYFYLLSLQYWLYNAQ